MVQEHLRRFSKRDIFSLHFLPTFLVFLMMMILIGFSWRAAQSAIFETENEQVQIRAQYIENEIKMRMQMNANTVQSAAGLFGSSTSVTRQEWKTYIESLDLKTVMPGIMGVGYVEMIPEDELQDYQNRVRAEGYKDFEVRPVSPARNLYSSITYIEPFEGRNVAVLGGDQLVEKERAAAMERARDTGEIAMTPTISLLDDNDQRTNGVSMYFPLYRKNASLRTVAERRAAHIGYVYAPLRMQRLLSNIFPDKNPDFNFEIFGNTATSVETKLYSQHPVEDQSEYNWLKEDIVPVFEQNWTIRYGAHDNIVPQPVRDRPQSVLLGGVVFSLIVSGLIYLLLQRRTRKMADKEDRKLQRAKDSMLSLASHQLRTPATGVKQYIGMVLEGFTGKITNEQREILNRAYDSNERQLRIINEFLYLAKAEADRIVISPQKFDLVEFVKQIVSDMETEINDAGHTVKLRLSSSKLMCFADMHSARMIIENLISNAIKYTPSGGVIHVIIKAQGKNATVCVEDNGIGIAKKDFPKLFQQFSRIPNEMTKFTSGSGIGLYLAQVLAKMNNGIITVKSDKGVGSKFTVQFPRKSVKNVTVATN